MLCSTLQAALVRAGSGTLLQTLKPADSTLWCKAGQWAAGWPASWPAASSCLLGILHKASTWLSARPASALRTWRDAIECVVRDGVGIDGRACHEEGALLDGRQGGLIGGALHELLHMCCLWADKLWPVVSVIAELTAACKQHADVPMSLRLGLQPHIHNAPVQQAHAACAGACSITASAEHHTHPDLASHHRVLHLGCNRHLVEVGQQVEHVLPGAAWRVALLGPHAAGTWCVGL